MAQGAPWLDQWESELLMFPNGRHDAQVDTLAYAAPETASKHRLPSVDGVFERVSGSLWLPNRNRLQV